MDTLLSRLVALSVRELVPAMLHAGISYGFDDRTGDWHVHGPAAGLEGSLSEVRALNCALHRLGLAAVDSLAGGGVLGIEAQVQPQPGGGCRLHWRLSGQPERRGGLSYGEAAARLQLQPLPGAEGTAHGRCPASQAAVGLAWQRTGFELHADFLLRRAWRRPAPQRPAFGSRHLWLVQPDAVLAASVARQASREGWTVATLHDTDAALQRLHQPAPGESPPALLLVFAHAAMAPATLQRLRRGLPRGVHAVLAVETGSLWLGHADTVPGFELCCHPFSQRDWRAWDRLLRQPAPDMPRPATPGGLKVVVAQHDDVARCLTQSLLQAMGFEVHSARDALQALDACLRLAPTVLLLDPALAPLPGQGLTQRLRTLQRAGLAAPCRIVLHGPGLGMPAGWQALADDVDGFLPQPVDLQALRSELRRWTVAHQG